MAIGKVLALSAFVALRSSPAESLEPDHSQHRGLQEKNRCFERDDDLSCVPGGDTIELEACGLTDDDLMDLAECFDSRGRDSIVNLNLNFNAFTYIPDGLFDNFDNLEQLSILENQLSTLPDGVFDGLPIKNLVLSSNALSSLPSDVFSGLGDSLQSLLLGNNKLGTVREELFRGLSKLDTLSLAENELTGLPALVFDGLSALQNLQLFRNAFTTLPAGLFDGLVELTRLTFGDNEDLLCLPDLTGSTKLTAEALELPSDDFDPTASCACPLEGEEGFCENCEPGVDGFVCSESAEDKTCTNGLPGVSQGDTCCEASCGTCGGTGCSGRGNGQDSCCTKNIADNGETCSVTGAAPCIMDGDVVPPTPAPVMEPATGFSCSGDAGILQGDICCEASCGTCGGEGCSGRGNGQDSCCTKNIAANGETCSVTGAAPCIVDGDVVPPTPAPVMEPTTGFSCSGDAGILQGDICCEVSCGTCGGEGCSGRGNGQDSCCTKNIAANGETCSVTGAAPCIVDGDVVPPTPAPVMEPTTGFSCSDDAGILQGNICCEASCGTCGGTGCSGRGNGQDSCCTKNIAANGETCSTRGAAPCIVDDVVDTPDYEEVGCYTDKNSPERIMEDVISSSSMTIETCQMHCTGSAYFGVQYGIECWCSGTDSVDYAYDVHGASTDCRKPCSGNAAETCGGDWAMNVYRNT